MARFVFGSVLNPRQVLVTASDGQVEAPITTTTSHAAASTTTVATLSESSPSATVVTQSVPVGGVVGASATVTLADSSQTVTVTGVTGTVSTATGTLFIIPGGVISSTGTGSAAIATQTTTTTGLLGGIVGGGSAASSTTLAGLITMSSSTLLMTITSTISSASSTTGTAGVVSPQSNVYVPVTHTAAFKAGISVAAVAAAAILLGLLLCCCCIPGLCGRRRRSDTPPPPMAYAPIAAAPMKPAPIVAAAPAPFIAPVPAPVVASPFLLAGGALGARALAARVANTPATRVGEMSIPVTGAAAAASMPHESYPRPQHLGPQLVPAGMVPVEQRPLLPAVNVLYQGAPQMTPIPAAYGNSYGNRNYDPVSPVNEGQQPLLSGYNNNPYTARSSPPVSMAHQYGNPASPINRSQNSWSPGQSRGSPRTRRTPVTYV